MDLNWTGKPEDRIIRANPEDGIHAVIERVRLEIDNEVVQYVSWWILQSPPFGTMKVVDRGNSYSEDKAKRLCAEGIERLLQD